MAEDVDAGAVRQLLRQVIGYALALLAAALLFAAMTDKAHAARRDCCGPTNGVQR